LNTFYKYFILTLLFHSNELSNVNHTRTFDDYEYFPATPHKIWHFSTVYIDLSL